MRLKEMNCPEYKLNNTTWLPARLILAAALMLATSASFADESDITYVDSVNKWGAWELDIEPAAGGLTQPTTQALNARNTKVALRTNSFSALAPPSVAVVAVTETPVAPPFVPPVAPPVAPPPPVTPTIPAAPTNFAPPGTSTTTPVVQP